MIGIYKIENMVNNKVYIGCSNDIERRWNDHRTRAFSEGDREYNKTLYRAFRKYGLDNFKFSIICECSKEDIKEKEIAFIELYDSYNNGYNETIGGDISGYDLQGERHPNSKLTQTDVEEIRKRYANKERRMEVYEIYKDRIGKSGFEKIWKGETWKEISMEVYTEENKKFHKTNSSMKGSNNGRARLTEKDVYNIRLRKKNGESSSHVYEDYKNLISKGSFRNIWSYQNWKNVVV